jgi:tetratricopeptide (TPR) repeat protein
MSNLSPITPSFTFGYWRPWKENSNLFDSYLDYAKDVSLTKYGADTVGSYINQASQEQVQAINQLGQTIGRGMNVLSNQMSDINKTLVFLNRNMDIQIEQQKLSNLLLHNIAELLRVPDSEKERQHSIELGIKFFVNAKKDSDLYADALEELLKAESLMKQDYFVLHRIGCIYLYVEKYINPEKAFEYFVRAAKYASVESDPSAIRVINILYGDYLPDKKNRPPSSNNKVAKIEQLVADSFEKGAFAAYVLGRFEDAVNYQSKALKFNSTSENRFLLSKYQVRNNNLKEAVDNLDKSIDEAPYLAIAAFKELDLINEPEVIKLIAQKNEVIDNKIKLLTENWKTVESSKASEVIKELSELSKKSYEIKIAHFNKYENEGKTINNGINELEGKIDAYINEVKQTTYCTFDADKIQTIINELKLAKDLPLEKMQVVFDKLKTETDADNLKIGSKYGGGIVFYLDDSGKHGLVCAEKDFGKAIMRANQFKGQSLDSGEYGISPEVRDMKPFTKGRLGEQGRQYSIALAEKLGYFAEEFGFFKNKMVLTKASTAPRLCLESKHNGFDDWYLPTIDELRLIHKLFLQLFDDSGEGRNGRFPNDFFDFKDDEKYWSSSVGGDYLGGGSVIMSFTRDGKIEPRYSCFGEKKLNVRAIRNF